METKKQGALLYTTVSEEDSKFVASVPEIKTESRTEKVKILAEKVSVFLGNQSESTLVPPEEEVFVGVSADEELDDEVKIVSSTVLTCSEYVRSRPVWDTKGLLFEVVEGALLVYREYEEIAEPIIDGATTTLSLTPTTKRDMVLQLPHRLFRSEEDTCIANDVVGVALDGSLIRNEDYLLYRVFDSETLIGYALDGFAIYGTASFEVDNCGGSDSRGEYRYYLNSERDGILGCFASTPVNL